MPHRLDSLLRPRSIAVLGATERMGTVGRHTIENLLKGGYEGRLHAVNPGYQSVCGLPCFPSLTALPGPVETTRLKSMRSSLSTMPHMPEPEWLM